MRLVTLHNKVQGSGSGSFLVNPFRIDYVTDCSVSGYNSIVSVAGEKFYVAENLHEIEKATEDAFRKQ